MVVALGTAQRQTHRNGGGCIHTISNICCLILFWNSSTFKVDRMVAIEPGCHELVCRRIRKQVTCELFSQEPVIWHVAVECADNPVSPAEHIPVTIDVISMGVCVAGKIQPHQSHPLTISWSLQESVNNSLISTRFCVGCKRIDVIDAWWQPCQVKCDPAKECPFICGGQWLETLLCKGLIDEVINRVLGTFRYA